MLWADIEPVLKSIGTLIPLSAAVATLGFLNNLRQTRIKENREEAARLRGLLNNLGLRAYIFNWSLLGDSQIKVGVLQIREMIESRIGKNPSVESLTALAKDPLLLESVVEKGWQESGVLKTFQESAYEFGKIQADMGNKIELVDAALEVITTKLRILFSVNLFVLFSIRNDDVYKRLSEAGVQSCSELIQQIHSALFHAAAAKKDHDDSFSAACKFAEELSKVAARVADKKILALARSRLSVFGRMREFWADKRYGRSERVFRAQLSRTLEKRFPEQAALLTVAAQRFIDKKRTARILERNLKKSSMRLFHLFKDTEGYEELKSAADKFHAAYCGQVLDKDLVFLETLLKIKSHGVDDPDVDLFLGSSSGVTELAKFALDRHAHAAISAEKVLAKYKDEKYKKFRQA